MDIIYIERIERKSIQGTAYSISSAGRALGMDRRSLYPYMRIAYLYIADYRIAKKAADKFSPKQPLLNGYMVWVLGKIKQIFALQNNRKLAIATIKSKPELLTLETYEYEQAYGQESISQGVKHECGRPGLIVA